MPLSSEDEARTLVLARIRGGLHDLGLTTRSPQSRSWIKAALDRLNIPHPETDDLSYWLSDSALVAWADAIERKLIAQQQDTTA